MNEEKVKEGLKAFTEIIDNAIDDLNKLIPEKPEPKIVNRGQFVPVMGEEYFYINGSSDVCKDAWDNDPVDKEHLESGNCYHTKQKALDFIRRAKIRVKLQTLADDAWGDVVFDWEDEDTECYSLGFCYKSYQVIFCGNFTWKDADTIYFPKEDSGALDSILAHVPEEDLKFYLGVER